MRNILAELLSASEAEWPSLLNEASDIFSSIAATSTAGNGSASTTPDTTREQLISSGTNAADPGARGSSQLNNSGSSDGAGRPAPAVTDGSDGHPRGADGPGAADDRDEGRGRDADALGVQSGRRAAGRQAERLDGQHPLE